MGTAESVTSFLLWQDLNPAHPLPACSPSSPVLIHQDAGARDGVAMEEVLQQVDRGVLIAPLKITAGHL